MAEVKNIATRDSYGNALKELAANGADKLVVLDADLSAATKTGIFKKEQEMIQEMIQEQLDELNRIYENMENYDGSNKGQKELKNIEIGIL